jgi:hypothetical protein
MARQNLKTVKPKTKAGKIRLERMKQKAQRKGDYKPPTAPKQCTLDPRYACNPLRCPPTRDRLANLKTTGEANKCLTPAA